MFGFSSGANCPTVQMSSAAPAATDASALSSPPTLGLSTTAQSPLQVPMDWFDSPPLKPGLQEVAASPAPSTIQSLCVFMIKSLLPDLEQRSHRGDIRGVAGVLQTAQSEGLLKRLQQRVMVVGRRILEPARTVARDDDGGDLAVARIGVAAAGGVAVRALVERDHDGVVAARPERGRLNLSDDPTHESVGDTDQRIVAEVARIARIDAVRRRSVHVRALVGN